MQNIWIAGREFLVWNYQHIPQIQQMLNFIDFTLLCKTEHCSLRLNEVLTPLLLVCQNSKHACYPQLLTITKQYDFIQIKLDSIKKIRNLWQWDRETEKKWEAQRGRETETDRKTEMLRLMSVNATIPERWSTANGLPSPGPSHTSCVCLSVWPASHCSLSLPHCNMFPYWLYSWRALSFCH